MMMRVVVITAVLATSAAQILPAATQEPPPFRSSGCVATMQASADVTYINRMSSQPVNARYDGACGAEIRFNDPCVWAGGEAQMTVARATQLCIGATRVIHWHDGADEWGYVAKGRIRTYLASPDGYPWESSNNEISQHGVWYFPHGWLHGFVCMTPESEGGCVFSLVFNSPVSVPIDNHNLDTTLAQAPDDVAAAALEKDVKAYQKMRPKFAGGAGPVVNATEASSPLITMAPPGFCDPECPDFVQTKAWPAAVDAIGIEKTVRKPGGVTLHQIRTSSFPFAATMSQERTELAPGAFRPIVWTANADSLLVVISGNITVGLQGGLSDSSNEHDAHKTWIESSLGPGDVAYFPIGRAYWFKENTGEYHAATITVFNVGDWKSVELKDATALMPEWAVSSSLRQDGQKNMVQV